MQVRVLGAHKLESYETRHTCFLIDGVLALDAGGLTSSLTLTEQYQVQAVLLTHMHFDHVRDIPTLGLATLDQPGTIDVYALPQTLDALRDHLLNWDIYPDFTKALGSRPPKYHFIPIQPDVVFNALGYEVRPISVLHPVPTVGFIVKSPDGNCVAYSGDTKGRLLPFFTDEMNPEILFVDLSFPNRLTELAQLTGHLSPNMLRQELEIALSKGLRLPRLEAVHLDPEHEQELSADLQSLAEDLGIDIAVGRTGVIQFG